MAPAYIDAHLDVVRSLGQRQRIHVVETMDLGDARRERERAHAGHTGNAHVRRSPGHRVLQGPFDPDLADDVGIFQLEAQILEEVVVAHARFVD